MAGKAYAVTRSDAEWRRSPEGFELRVPEGPADADAIAARPKTRSKSMARTFSIAAGAVEAHPHVLADPAPSVLLVLGLRRDRRQLAQCRLVGCGSCHGDLGFGQRDPGKMRPLSAGRPCLGPRRDRHSFG
jgi:hypothetical protein